MAFTAVPGWISDNSQSLSPLLNIPIHRVLSLGSMVREMDGLFVKLSI